MSDMAIIDVLKKEYLSDYVDILGLTLSATGYYPEQADSQIRNAMTHLARAANAQNQAKANVQIEKAKSHIQRAKRDCLKLAIIEKKKDIKDHINSIRFANGGLTEEIISRRLDVFADYNTVLSSEAKGEDITDELTDVLTSYFELEQALLDTDKIAYKPSRLVKHAVWLIEWGKKLWVIFAVATIGLIIKSCMPEA